MFDSCDSYLEYVDRQVCYTCVLIQHCCYVCIFTVLSTCFVSMLHKKLSYRRETASELRMSTYRLAN